MTLLPSTGDDTAPRWLTLVDHVGEGQALEGLGSIYQWVSETSARCNLCQREVASKGGNTSNITKHLERGVFDCYNKASKVSSLANAKDCSAVAVAPGYVSVMSSHGKFVVQLVVITVG